ncbi:MAG: hypothetical protein WCT36_05640 [Candidatus Gracilibacteria bacterium]|jgi:hypothetical protein
MVIFPLLLGILVLTGFGLFISAFVSILRNAEIERNFKPMWLTFLCVTGPIGGITYFFMFKKMNRAWIGLIVSILVVVMYFVTIAAAIGYSANKVNNALLQSQNSKNAQFDVFKNMKNLDGTSDEY